MGPLGRNHLMVGVGLPGAKRGGGWGQSTSERAQGCSAWARDRAPPPHLPAPAQSPQTHKPSAMHSRTSGCPCKATRWLLELVGKSRRGFLSIMLLAGNQHDHEIMGGERKHPRSYQGR